jgi:hypothetical protein
MFNSTNFSIYRLAVTTGNKKSYADSNLDIVGHMEPMDVEFGALSEGAFGKSYKFYSDDIASTLTEGDRLYDGTNYFEVKGVQTYQWALKHLQAMAEKVIKQ